MMEPLFFSTKAGAWDPMNSHVHRMINGTRQALEEENLRSDSFD